MTMFVLQDQFCIHQATVWLPAIINYLADDKGSRVAQFALSAVALAVAVVGAYIALRTYTSAARDAANSHMHGLFRDYLRARLDVSLATLPEMPRFPNEPVSSQLTALKLYALEEMYTWVCREERLPREWFILNPLDRARAKADREDFLAAWRRTILVHAGQEKDDVMKSFEDYASCYSMTFLRFINSGWQSRELAALIAIHQRAIDQGQQRPPGNLERAELADRPSRAA
ncbi:hypothetical protein [Caulobacter endophyticus]|nr:hypothetical protein [Caulobacter endophyticus]